MRQGGAAPHSPGAEELSRPRECSLTFFLKETGGGGGSVEFLSFPLSVFQTCLRQHEEDMEHAFAVARSKEKTCGICMEVVMDKPKGEAR